MKTEAQDLEARADEMLARLQAFSEEISTLAAPISPELKNKLARRYKELQAEVEVLNLLRTSRN
ncbi:MAG TPA: hypothetical protein VMF08_04780 [Candidatus Sulfotelmatobacter sp.]|nr:hypothetical protein [Candidatus Sulfotelmatobacter sp.]